MLTALSVAACLGMAGCAGGEVAGASPSPPAGAVSPSPDVSPTGAFVDSARAVLERARQVDASDAQLALLQSAVESGDLSLAQLREAVDNTFACFEASGLTYSETADTRPNAPPGIHYSYDVGPGMAEEDAFPLGQACIAQESYFVEMLFAATPHSVESQEALFAGIRDELIECLESKGVEIDEDAGKQEVIRAVTAGGPTSDGYEGDPVLEELLEPCHSILRDALALGR